jgi:hypothetical protein
LQLELAERDNAIAGLQVGNARADGVLSAWTRTILGFVGAGSDGAPYVRIRHS